nr:hypothetical protein [Tanacetum cinerariifolium]
MSPRMRIQSAGRPIAESQRRGTGEWVGRSGKGRGPKGDNDEGVDELNGQRNDQGPRANRNVEGVNGGVGRAPDFSMIIAQQLQNLLPTILAQAVQISRALTDEAVRNGSIKKVKERGNVGEPSKDKNGRDDYKRTRIGNDFATTTNPVGRENMGAWPKCTTCNSYHALEEPCRTFFNCNCPGHFSKDFRVVPRNVNPINVRNPTPARGACYECGSTNYLKPACPRLNRAEGPRGNHPNQVVVNNEGQGRGTKGTKLGVGHSCWV